MNFEKSLLLNLDVLSNKNVERMVGASGRRGASSRVEVVRQRGGNCLSRALQQVTVSREEEAVNQFSVHYLPPIQQEEMQVAEEREQRAATRGREAARWATGRQALDR